MYWCFLFIDDLGYVCRVIKFILVKKNMIELGGGKRIFIFGYVLIIMWCIMYVLIDNLILNEIILKWNVYDLLLYLVCNFLKERNIVVLLFI